MALTLDLNDPATLVAVKYLLTGYAIEKRAPFSALARQVLDASDPAWGPADEALWGQMFAGADPPLGQLHKGLVQPDAKGLCVLWNAAKDSKVTWSALNEAQQDEIAAAVAPWLARACRPGAVADVVPTDDTVKRQVLRTPSVVKSPEPPKEPEKKSNKGMWFALGAAVLTIGGIAWAANSSSKENPAGDEPEEDAEEDEPEEQEEADVEDETETDEEDEEAEA